jgi:hypothetical protein
MSLSLAFNIILAQLKRCNTKTEGQSKICQSWTSLVFSRDGFLLIGIRSRKFGMTQKPDATEVPIGLDGHLDVADCGHIGLGINGIEVVDLMRTKFYLCQKDNVEVISEAALETSFSICITEV